MVAGVAQDPIAVHRVRCRGRVVAVVEIGAELRNARGLQGPVLKCLRAQRDSRNHRIVEDAAVARLLAQRGRRAAGVASMMPDGLPRPKRIAWGPRAKIARSRLKLSLGLRTAK
jgi:hypothetical protein